MSEPHPTITVRALAAELGRDLPSMYRLCNAQQVYAKGPDTEISLSNADRLRDAHEDFVRRTQRLRSIALAPTAWTEQPLTGAAAAAAKQWPTLDVTYARRIAKDWTRKHSIAPSTAAAWWAAGLGPDDALLATILNELGVRPEHLPVRVRGETILERLREQSMPPEQVARLLRSEGLIPT